MEQNRLVVDIDKLRPTYCVWELTLACNLRCGHCGSRAGRPRPDELNTEECLKLVHDLAGLGCEVITLSGGEPTLRKDWYEIARAIRQHGMIPNMVTNGHTLNAEKVRMMTDAPLANVAISVDGPPEVHDQIRGAGSFERIRRAMGLLAEAGISTTVMTTINTLNLSRLEETYEHAVALGADRWRCQLGKPMGNLKAHHDWVIRPRDLLKLLPTLWLLDQSGKIPVGIGDSIGYWGPYDSELRATNWKGQPQCWQGCQAGKRAIGIEANGGIKGCLSMQAFSGANDRFLEGNIRERSLETIWRDPDAFSYNRRFAESDLKGACRKCNHRISCRGGAKCVAAATTGDLAENLYCYHRVASQTMQIRAPRAALQVIQAAAASLLLVGAGTCGGPGDDDDTDKTVEPSIVPEYGVEVSPSAVPEYGVEPSTTPEPSAMPDYGVEPSHSPEPTAMPDYGVEPTHEPEPTAMPEYGVEPTQPEPTAMPEYGVEPTQPEPTAMPDYGVEPTRTPEPTAMPDYGVEPTRTPEPTAMPDYGVEPTPTPMPTAAPEYGVEPTAMPDYGVEPTMATEYGVEPTIAPDYGVETPTPKDPCKAVCCDCDYGELPPGVYEECCTENLNSDDSDLGDSCN